MVDQESAEVKFNRDKVFLCIDYPAVVKNVDKMLDTLGGEKNVSKIVSDPMLRFDLKFRPNDIYCKPMYGDKVDTTRLVLKVKRKKVKEGGATASSTNSYEYVSEVLGIVDQTYKFKSMVDFQYLPMEKSSSGKYTSLVEKLIPSKMHSSSWLQEDSPLLLTPLIFSRIDSPCDYHFRKDPAWRKPIENTKTKDDGFISRIRNKRSGFTIIASYDDITVPDKPHENATLLLSTKLCQPELVEKVKQAFEERPIWTRNGLIPRVDYDKPQLKYILPAVAYYYITGPWRALWVKFGYDPRTEPSAKIYQLLDFRIRKQIGREKIPVSAKRPGFYNVLPIKFVNQSHMKTVTIDKENFAEVPDKDAAAASQIESDKIKVDSSYIFEEGIMPPCRQMFYQLCDIRLDEVQSMIHTNDGNETRCTEKDGWCVPGIQEKCRNIMMSQVELLVAAQERGKDTKVQRQRRLDSDSESNNHDESDDSANEMALGLGDMEVDDR